MMAIPDLPTFEDREKLTAGKLNELRDAVESKFQAITGADLTWPLVAEGNLDMGGQYSIIGLQTLWNVVNADEYASLQAAVDAAVASSGGCVFIPPYNSTNKVADGVNIGGSNILIMGCGSSSRIELTSGSTSGYMFQTSDGVVNVGITNLTLDGMATGTNQKGVRVQQGDGFFMERVWMEDFTGAFIELTNDGTNGNACTNTRLSGLDMKNGTTSHIIGDDIDGLTMTDIISRAAGADAISLAPAAVAGKMRDIQLDTVRVTVVTGIGIRISGVGAASVNQSRIQLQECQVSGNTGDAFVIGDTGEMLQYVDIVGCTAHDSLGDGFKTNITSGTMKNCHAYDATGDGLDMLTSFKFRVSDCDFPDAGANGIDASALIADSFCAITECDVRRWTTEGIAKPTTDSKLDCGNNLGDRGKIVGGTISKFIGYTNVGVGAETAYTYTIPAGTLTKAGDGFCVTLLGFTSGGPVAGTFSIQVDTNQIVNYSTAANTSVHLQAMGFLRDDPDVATNFEYGGLVTDGVPATDLTHTAATVDFTGDIDLIVTVQATGGAGRIQARSIMITFFEGEELGT
jgi:hypothetical protein